MNGHSRIWVPSAAAAVKRRRNSSLFAVAETAREVLPAADDLRPDHAFDLFIVEAVGRTRDAQGPDHLAGVVADRCGDAAQPFLELLEIRRVAPVAGDPQVLQEFVG